MTENTNINANATTPATFSILEDEMVIFREKEDYLKEESSDQLELVRRAREKCVQTAKTPKDLFRTVEIFGCITQEVNSYLEKVGWGLFPHKGLTYRYTLQPTPEKQELLKMEWEKLLDQYLVRKKKE